MRGLDLPYLYLGIAFAGCSFLLRENANLGLLDVWLLFHCKNDVKLRC